MLQSTGLLSRRMSVRRIASLQIFCSLVDGRTCDARIPKVSIAVSKLRRWASCSMAVFGLSRAIFSNACRLLAMP